MYSCRERPLDEDYSEVLKRSERGDAEAGAFVRGMLVVEKEEEEGKGEEDGNRRRKISYLRLKSEAWEVEETVKKEEHGDDKNVKLEE